VSKPVPINLVPHAALLEGSSEFLRLWARPQGPMTCFVNPAKLGADPFLFGMALVDAVRHGARAWAQAVNIPVAEAEARIWEGLDAERHHATDQPRTPELPADDDFITYTQPQDLN
jgi:hypothetical protein